MQLITLTTDGGSNAFFPAALRAKLMQLLPKATILDIAHGISKYNITEAAYTVKNAIEYFPAETLHLVEVGYPSKDCGYCIGIYENNWIIAPDNGILSIIGCSDIRIFTYSINEMHFMLHQLPELLQIIEKYQDFDSITHVGKYQEMNSMKPYSEQRILTGNILHFDGYNNAITNINSAMIEEFTKGRRFRINLKGQIIRHISAFIADMNPGELGAIYNSSGNLVLMVQQGNVKMLFGLKENESIKIEVE